MNELGYKGIFNLKKSLRYELFRSISKKLREVLLNILKNKNFNRIFLEFDRLYPEIDDLSLCFKEDSNINDFTNNLESSSLNEFVYSNLKNLCLETYQPCKSANIAKFTNLSSLNINLVKKVITLTESKQLCHSISLFTNVSTFTLSKDDNIIETANEFFEFSMQFSESKCFDVKFTF